MLTLSIQTSKKKHLPSFNSSQRLLSILSVLTVVVWRLIRWKTRLRMATNGTEHACNYKSSIRHRSTYCQARDQQSLLQFTAFTLKAHAYMKSVNVTIGDVKTMYSRLQKPKYMSTNVVRSDRFIHKLLLYIKPEMIFPTRRSFELHRTERHRVTRRWLTCETLIQYA